jgi:hypothetical protein
MSERAVLALLYGQSYLPAGLMGLGCWARACSLMSNPQSGHSSDEGPGPGPSHEIDVCANDDRAAVRIIGTRQAQSACVRGQNFSL